MYPNLCLSICLLRYFLEMNLPNGRALIRYGQVVPDGPPEACVIHTPLLDK